MWDGGIVVILVSRLGETLGGIKHAKERNNERRREDEYFKLRKILG